MKLFTAVLAVAVVLIGSAFTSNKFVTKTFGMYLTNGTAVSGQSDYTQYQIVDFDDATGESCSNGSESRCQFTFNSANQVAIDRTSTGVPQAGDYGTYNYILLSNDATTKIRSVQIRTTRTSGTGVALLPLTFQESSAVKVFNWNEKPF